MTRQEFNEAYDNGYKHGYEAGRNETTVGMTKKKIDILKRLRGKMDDDMLDTFYETKDEEREALSEAIKILDQGFDVDNHDSDYDTALKMAIKSLEQMPFEDATNGDVLSLLFQDDSFRIAADKHGYLHIRGVKKDWWNAPYKSEREDKGNE